jgi:hypothetical protein
MDVILDVDVPYTFDVPEVRKQIVKELEDFIKGKRLSMTTGPAIIRNIHEA